MDEKFWAEVERARRMTPSEKVSEGLRLRDEWYAQLLVNIKAEFPGISDENALAIRSSRVTVMHRLRSEEKSRVLEMIAADHAAKVAEGSA